MKIYLDNYIFYIEDINYFSLYNFKETFQLYYHNKKNYCSNTEFIKMIESFSVDDFLQLGDNKITKNVLYLMNEYSTVNLYKLLNNGYKYFNNDMLNDLFTPFNIIKIYKNKFFIKKNLITPNLIYFEDIVDIDKFNEDFYNYTYVIN